MHIFWKILLGSSFKMPSVGICVKHTLYSLYWNQNKFCEPEQMEDNTSNIPIGRMCLAMSWRSVHFNWKQWQTKK